MKPRRKTSKAVTNGKRPAAKKGRLTFFGPEVDTRLDKLCRQVPKLSAAEIIRTAVEEYLDRIDTDPNILEVMRNPRLRSPTFIAALLHGKVTIPGQQAQTTTPVETAPASQENLGEEPPPPVRRRRRPPSPEDDFTVLPRPGFRPVVKAEDFEPSKEDGSLLADVAEPPEMKPPPDAPLLEADNIVDKIIDEEGAVG